MKKIVRTLCLVAMVALVATSCKKKVENANVTVAFEETAGFNAGPSFDGSKAYLDPTDGYNFKWNDNDEIAFYNLSSDYTESTCTKLTAVIGSNGKARTQFTGPNIGAKKDGYFVFYHADKAAGAQTGVLKGEGNVETFTVPATQTYDKNRLIDTKSLVMACETPEAGVFMLQHIFGFLNVAIGHNNPANGQVDYITVTDDQWHLTGDLSIKLDEVNTQELTAMIDHLATYGDDAAYQAALADYLQHSGYCASGTLGNTITLDCDDVELISNNYRYFLIPLRPGALYKGFEVTVHYTSGATSSYHFGEDLANLIKPGYFTNIYTLSSGHWYINNAWVKP